jgi:hypothetical protein
MTNRQPRIDIDSDDRVENSQVDGLINLGSTDSFSQYPLANTDLTNSTVTIAGNQVSLGGSTAIDHNDLSTINSDDHHTKTTSQSDLTDFSSDAQNIYVQSSQPSNPSVDDIWIDTS